MPTGIVCTFSASGRLCSAWAFAVRTIKKATGQTQPVPYIPNALIMPAAAIAKCLGRPMGICPARVRKLQISTNICGRKLTTCGYKFKWSFEDALEDWFNDNGRKGLL